jgi:hypothetical protein
LLLSLTNAETGRNELVDVRHIRTPIPTILKASGALPVLYNRTVRIDGVPYVDGGLTDSLPLRQGISRGCPDILVLLTRAPLYVPQSPNVVLRSLFGACIGWKYPGLQTAYGTNHLRVMASRALALGEGVPDEVSIATICPSAEDMVVGRMTTDRRRLVDGACRLARKTARAFAKDEDAIVKVFRDFDAG